MHDNGEAAGAALSERLTTGIPGFDAILDGGLLTGAVCLIAGPAGSGKTTVANQVAFHHVRGGGRAVFATVLAETHERMIARLRSFAFYDSAAVGDGLTYYSLLENLEEGGLDGLLGAVRRLVREQRATLLVIDGASFIEELSPSAADYRRFLQRLQSATALLGCTTLLLSDHGPATLGPVGMHTDGIVQLGLEPVGERDRRIVRVVKLRGAEHVTGRHDFSIDGRGITVHPRLESRMGRDTGDFHGDARVGTGLPVLDGMLGGGLLRGTSTMVLGTAGVGKTLCGLHFLANGVAGGKRVLVATFHEKRSLLAQTAADIGLDLAGPMDDGRLRVLWHAPLELSPDAWAWELLSEVERHRPTLVFIDGLSDVERLILTPERISMFIVALTNELRNRGITTLMTVEMEDYVATNLVVPVPSASATMDNGILLRHVEVGSRVHRLISVLKARQSAADAEIREFVIGRQGIEIRGIFAGSNALLTGSAGSDARPAPDGAAEA